MKVSESNNYKVLMNKLESYNKLNIRQLGQHGVKYGNADQHSEGLSRIMYYMELMEDMKKIKDTQYGPEAEILLKDISRKQSDWQNNIREDETEKVFDSLVEENPDLKGKIIDNDGVQKAYAKYRELAKPVKAAEKEEADVTTKNSFDYYLNRLEKSRTRKNSDQYENLIKVVRYVNSTDKIPQGKNLSDKQNCALKLLVIKKKINEYIDHKAKDGVNKNVGGKLAAVEAINAIVEKRLSELKLDPFMVNGERINLKAMPITREQELQQARKANPNANLPKPRENEESSLNDDCMQRIIAKSIEKKYSKTHSLEKMRESFAKNEMAQPANKGPQL